jgi:UDP-GlcNAc:undecaprenyl-phosphate GlcNAc-1-phosphate transferase
LAVGLTLVLRWAAPRLGMLDLPGGRKKHGRPTPLLGGVAVYGAAAGGYSLFAALDARTVWLMGGAFGLLALGLLDDRFGLRARFRLAIQLVGASGIIAGGVHFTWFPWMGANYVISLLWLVGMMNAFNCLDCADGTAAGLAVIASAAFCLIAMAQGHFAVALLAVALLGACAGFLAFNFPPASIFLGDAGSAVLGFLLGGLAIAASRGAPAPLQAWMAALPLGLPIWDIVLVHLRRYRAGTRGLRRLLESTGRDHLPHRLAAAGLTRRQVAGTVYLIAALLALPAALLPGGGLPGLVLAVEITLVALVAGERRFANLVLSAGGAARGAAASTAPGRGRSERRPTRAGLLTPMALGAGLSLPEGGATCEPASAQAGPPSGRRAWRSSS